MRFRERAIGVSAAPVGQACRRARQSIRRRGRIPREAPGKEQAEIFDLMVRVPGGAVDDEIERRLLFEELRRVSEFAGLARSGGQIIETHMPLLRDYDLVHHLP